MIIKKFFLGGEYDVESFEFETGGSISSGDIFSVFGISAAASQSKLSSDAPTEADSKNLQFDDYHVTNDILSTDAKTLDSSVAADKFISDLLVGMQGDNNLIIQNPNLNANQIETQYNLSNFSNHHLYDENNLVGYTFF